MVCPVWVQCVKYVLLTSIQKVFVALSPGGEKKILCVFFILVPSFVREIISI